MVELTQKRAFIFRICHIDNFEWHAENDLVCANSEQSNPNFVEIGKRDLIMNRASRDVPIEPSGTLSDYIPFYFTPFSIMFFNIHTGWGGIRKRENKEIIVFVSSVHNLIKHNVKFVFTDRHAYLAAANFYTDVKHLDKVDWKILQARSFKQDPDDPGKGERYQAEILVYKRLPLEALLGVVCYNDNSKSRLHEIVRRQNRDVKIVRRSEWYF